VVQLPPRDPSLSPEEWQLGEMPYAQLNRKHDVVGVGLGALSDLPRANRIVLIVAARDVLMLHLNVPPVKGARLLQALPNVIEDALIQDVHSCHIAVDHPTAGDGRRTVAALDRAWFHFVLYAFVGAGYAQIKAVPIVRCLPPAHVVPAVYADGATDEMTDRVTEGMAEGVADATTQPHQGPAAPAVALLYRVPTTAAAGSAADGKGKTRFELVIARGETGEGIAVRLDALAAAVQALSATGTLQVYRLSAVPGTPQHPDDAVDSSFPAQPYAFEQLAQAALRCDFDLCQFEFSRLTPERGALRVWRLPIALALVTLLIALAAVNLEWWIAAHQNTALLAQQRSLLQATFPKVRVMLDPPVQMTQQLKALSVRAGELGPDDFLTLSSNLARALPPIAPEAIAQLAYKERRLQVTFTPDTQVDGGFADRLHANGLTGHADGTTWLIGSAP